MIRTLIIAATILGSCATCAAPVAFAADPDHACTAPPGVAVLKSFSDLPAPVQQEMHRVAGEISPIDGPFDATDVVMHSPPHFTRLRFMWHHGNLWLIAWERGGIAHSFNKSLISLSADGHAASPAPPKYTGTGDFCESAQHEILAAR